MKYQKIIKYLVTMVCTQPLHIGSASGDKEEVLIHPTDDVPFIQASSLAGVLRQYYVKQYDEEQAEQLFGVRRFGANQNSMEGSSKVRFGDGIFHRESLTLELRPRVKINSKTGTCDADNIEGTNRQAGHKFNMEYIGAGAVFDFSVYLYDEHYQKDFEEILSAVYQENIQFGGQKSNGCGFMKVQGLKRKIFDMTNAKERRQWAEEESLADSQYETISSEIKMVPKTTTAYEVTVFGSTEGELLVKSIAVSEYGKGAPDSMNIQNAANEYIVPGSSLKGAVRNQMEKIAGYIGNKYVIEDTFGKPGNDADEGKIGNIVFYDTIVGNREDNDKARVKNRIHIDKFTGGVMHGGLFNEKNVSGDMQLHIMIQDRNNPDGTCGLLLMALRDMAVGVMSVGSGYSVGKGIIHVDQIIICDHVKQNKAVIKFESGSIADESGIIARCMSAVRPKEEAV